MILRNIELFCEVVAHRSFSKAAEARNLSQPAVSQALQQLEDRLGVRLIDRSKRPFDLTPAGHVYYEECRPLVDQFHQLEDKIRVYSGTVAGRLTVVSIYSVGLLQMKEYVEKYRDLYPDVTVRLDYASPDAVYSCILRDEAELGIISFPRDGGDVSCIDWLEQEMVVVVGADHPLAGRDDISLEEINGSQFVAFTSDLTIRRATDRLLRKQEVSVNITHQFDNIENIKRAAEIGLGISILPLPTVRREVEFGTLCAIPFTGTQLVRPLGIVHKRNRHLSNAAEKFVDLLKTEAGTDSAIPVLQGSLS